MAGQGRKAIIGAVCEQTNKADMGFTLAAMRYPLEALSYEIIDELAVYGIFDKATVKELDEMMEKAIQSGRAFAGSF